MTDTALRRQLERHVDRLAQSRDSVVRLRERLRAVKQERDQAEMRIQELEHELLLLRTAAEARENILLKALDRARMHGSS